MKRVQSLLKGITGFAGERLFSVRRRLVVARRILPDLTSVAAYAVSQFGREREKVYIAGGRLKATWSDGLDCVYSFRFDRSAQAMTLNLIFIEQNDANGITTHKHTHNIGGSVHPHEYTFAYIAVLLCNQSFNLLVSD